MEYFKGLNSFKSKTKIDIVFSGVSFSGSWGQTSDIDISECMEEGVSIRLTFLLMIFTRKTAPAAAIMTKKNANV